MSSGVSGKPSNPELMPSILASGQQGGTGPPTNIYSLRFVGLARIGHCDFEIGDRFRHPELHLAVTSRPHGVANLDPLSACSGKFFFQIHAYPDAFSPGLQPRSPHRCNSGTAVSVCNPACTWDGASPVECHKCCPYPETHQE